MKGAGEPCLPFSRMGCFYLVVIFLVFFAPCDIGAAPQLDRDPLAVLPSGLPGVESCRIDLNGVAVRNGQISTAGKVACCPISYSEVVECPRNRD